MTRFRLVQAAIYALIGYSAFMVFIILKNYPSAILAFISGLTDSVLFFLHYLVRKGRLNVWYSPEHLRQICRLGIIVGVVGLLSLGYHITLQVMLKTPATPIPDSHIIPIVWSWFAFRSGLFLMYYCIKYQNREHERLLGNGTSKNEESTSTTA